MKTKLPFLAACLLFAAAAQAQTTPTSPQYSGRNNQTALPPTNPTTPTNPGTISQQSADQVPTMQQNNNLDVNVPQGQPINRNATDLPANRVTTPATTPTTMDRPLRPRAGRRGTSPTQTVPPPQR
jgi:hypothetical protein